MLTPVYFNLFTISFSCFTNTVSFTSNLDEFFDIINHLLAMSNRDDPSQHEEIHLIYDG